MHILMVFLMDIRLLSNIMIYHLHKIHHHISIYFSHKLMLS